MQAHLDQLAPALGRRVALRRVGVGRGAVRGRFGVRAALGEPADVVHLNPSMRPRAFVRDLAFGLRCARRGQRVLLHLHGWDDAFVATWLRRVGLGWAGSLRWATLTEARRSDLVRLGIPRAHVGVVPPCARAWDLPPRDPEGPWVFVGRLVRSKGLHDLLAVARREVVVVGDGPERAALQAQARGRPVRFVGWQADPSPYLAAAAALVLPSYDEGVPVVALEALGSGRPVVGTAVGGLEGLLGSAAVVPGDRAALARALDQVQAPPPAEVARIRATYAPEAVAARCVALYETLWEGP